MEEISIIHKSIFLGWARKENTRNKKNRDEKN